MEIVTGPSPAFVQQQQANQPDLLGQYSRILQLKSLQNQQALAPLQLQQAQQQVQAGQLENQKTQQDLQARQAVSQAMSGAVTKDANGNVSFDSGKLQQGLANGPAAYQIPQVMKGITDFQKSQIDLQDSVTGLQQKSADMIGSAASAIKAAGYDRNLAHGLLDTLPPSPQLNQIRAQIDGPNFPQLVDSAIQNSPAQQKMQNEQTVAKLRAATPEAQQMNSWLAQNPGKTPADYQVYKTNLGVQADIAKETNPQIMRAKEQLAASEAAARQAVSQGDPKAAAQLLVNGDATLSQLKARGSTPEFIAKSLFYANQLSGGKYNAAQADAQFDVAKSPANVAFFGSANSLTDKGGTLDQLAAAAKDIPGGQVPVFNSIADAEKAATGSGPIAKYASLALGVADDYSKVMGGGQGSDTSRTQALKLISASQSPEQRAASIEGIRGAVGSQINSRIGNNPVLKRMYGTVQGGTSGLTVTAPNGKTYTFKSQADADAFKQKAGIQ